MSGEIFSDYSKGTFTISDKIISVSIVMIKL